MKKHILKLISIILSVVLFTCLLQTTCVFADGIEEEKLHELVPTSMSYSGHAHKECGSSSQKGQFRTLWNNYCAVYAITLETDKSFDMSLLDTATGRTGVVYRSGLAGYGPHLDYAFTGYSDSDAHNAVAQKLGDSISVNGVTIAEAFKENTYASMSILVGISDNKITLKCLVNWAQTQDLTV